MSCQFKSVHKMFQIICYFTNMPQGKVIKPLQCLHFLNRWFFKPPNNLNQISLPSVEHCLSVMLLPISQAIWFCKPIYSCFGGSKKYGSYWSIKLVRTGFPLVKLFKGSSPNAIQALVVMHGSLTMILIIRLYFVFLSGWNSSRFDWTHIKSRWLHTRVKYSSHVQISLWCDTCLS